MPVIAAEREICTVIVTVDAPIEKMSHLRDHARSGLELFRRFPGFLGGALHHSGDGRRLVQYLQWRSEADHLNCVQDPQWDDHPSSKNFLAMVASGEAVVDVRVFDVVAAVDVNG